MFKFILLLLKIIFLPLDKSKKEIILELVTVNCENKILKRKLDGSGKKIRFSRLQKFFYALISKLSGKFKAIITIVKPETVLKWYHNIIKKRWDYSEKKKVGRPGTSQEIKDLILRLKNENLSWGYKKIQGELMKLGIELDKNTIAKIISDFRKHGKVKTGLGWKKFIQSHIESLFATDFFTIDTLFGKRLYVFFIICLKTREIVKYRVTESPTRLFVGQQLMDWRWDKEEEKVYLIHDRASVFMGLDYQTYGIKEVPTSGYAPNMNAFAERFVRSIRNEAFDWFVIIKQKQVEKILEEYVSYYNKYRPHQGIEQQTPQGFAPQKEGTVIAFPVLSGLHHYYMRKAS